MGAGVQGLSEVDRCVEVSKQMRSQLFDMRALLHRQCQGILRTFRQGFIEPVQEPRV
ncbi:hypothetical protein D777_01490 [Marinobacter nitratireducens]|uniref:Uncharacterized protein n=1 Tax=Marinobacter nitratireducens TaxID=1137280 RepID=A0A072N289_9GAMM|nr:hypothetical protein D777_01490 [Marinobacter nitratireducens]